jgi:uncharacterized membrane protein
MFPWFMGVSLGKRLGMQRSSPPVLPGILLGIGLGGFVDGIVLHQILQWHHMLTAEGCCSATSVAGLEDNTLADGIFHTATWVAVLAGSTLAVRAWQRGEFAPPWRSHFGAALLGWGLFNVLEGLIDHQILGIHHVRDDLGAPIGWDIGFLVFGALQCAVGLAMASSRKRVTQTPIPFPPAR